MAVGLIVCLFPSCSRPTVPPMGHTITPRERATEALRLPLEHFAGWRLAVDCGSPKCARGRACDDMRQVARQYPAI